MTDSNQTDSNGTKDSPLRRKRSPLLLFGMFLWITCLIGIGLGWSQWRSRYLVRIQATDEAKRETSADDAADDARQGKSIKLIPQKDGSFAVQEVTSENIDNPWDPNGIEDFSFTDPDRKTITNQDLLGKPFVISFIFTLCRGPCPNVTQEMRELQDRMKDYDFNLVSLTVDPERDTAEVLKTYRDAHKADPGRWKFLTGEQAEIYGLIQRSFLMPVEEEKDRDKKPGFEIIHSTNIMLVDATGRVIGKFNAQKQDEMAKLRKELKRIAPLKSKTTKNSNE